MHDTASGSVCTYLKCVQFKRSTYSNQVRAIYFNYFSKVDSRFTRDKIKKQFENLKERCLVNTDEAIKKELTCFDYKENS